MKQDCKLTLADCAGVIVTFLFLAIVFVMVECRDHHSTQRYEPSEVPAPTHLSNQNL